MGRPKTGWTEVTVPAHRTLKQVCASLSNLNDSNAAYWIGVILCLGRRDGRDLVVDVTGQGIQEYAIALARFLGRRSVLVRGGSTACRIALGPRRVVDLLARCSVPAPTPSRLAVPAQLESSAAFWRGVMDSRGWVCTVTCRRSPDRSETRWSAGLSCGSRNLVSRFSNFVKSICPDWRGKPVHTSTWGVYLVGPTATHLVRYVYAKNDILRPDKAAQILRILDGKRAEPSCMPGTAY